MIFRYVIKSLSFSSIKESAEASNLKLGAKNSIDISTRASNIKTRLGFFKTISKYKCEILLINLNISVKFY